MDRCKTCSGELLVIGNDEEGADIIDCPICIMTGEMRGLQVDLNTLRETADRTQYDYHRAIEIARSLLSSGESPGKKVIATSLFLNSFQGEK